MATLAAVVLAIVMTLLPTDRTTALLALAAPLGAFLFALYPLCVAHVNDHVSEGEFVEACSGMLLLYGGGSIVGPMLAASLMGWAGSNMLFIYIAGVYALFAVFVLTRLLATPRPSSAEREDFVVMPSSATLGLELDPRSVELDADEASDEPKESPAG
jgi:MFS family permease